MTLQMPSVGFQFVHRLLRVCTCSQRHVRHRDSLVKLTKSRSGIRTFSTGSVKYKENENEDPSGLSTELTPRQAAPGRRRSLSPLERISSLLPQDALSPEVMQLREQSQEAAEDNSNAPASLAQRTQEQSGHPEMTHGQDGADDPRASEPNATGRLTAASLPGETPLVPGELLIAEYYKKGSVDFRKMFNLQTGTRLHSNWGSILHDDMVGKPAGQYMKSSLGVRILIRRPSLEDYVLYMRRGPAIAYPKDASTMLMMMDVTEGDSVLESGSGSGAMSLFVSRAVGSKGSVLSVELRQDHHKRAVTNYNRWRTSWSLRRGGEEWPDNVRFHNADLRTASSLLAGRAFHAVALDLMNPQLVLPSVIPHLYPGAVCAVYLANVTQVIDLLEGLRCLPLPLLCEHIIEVPVRHWLVAPALQKNGQYCIRKVPSLDAESSEKEEETADETDKEESTTDGSPAFGSIPYIARPHPVQLSHTAFLVKLRKCVQ